MHPRRPLLALGLLLPALAACEVEMSKRRQAERTIDQALEVAGQHQPPPATGPAPWTGAPLPITTLDESAWHPLELPEIPYVFGGRRTKAGWLLASVVPDSEAHLDRLTLVHEGEARTLMETEHTPRPLRLGEEILVGLEDEGLGHHLRFDEAEARLERIELPKGNLALAGAKRYVATGWSLSARSFEVYEQGAGTPIYASEEGVRTVGMGVIGDALIVGVQHRDRSTGASVAARAVALSELDQGRGQAAAALAGPARSDLRTIGLGPEHPATIEPFPQQRLQDITVLDEGWLVAVTEGTLAAALRDGVIVARAPGETSGWRLLARDLETGLGVQARGPWICIVEMPTEGQRIHCLAPALGRHLVTPSFEQVHMWDIVEAEDDDGEPGWELVFEISAGAGQPDRAVALPLR
jgi:hypothetical protein